MSKELKPKITCFPNLAQSRATCLAFGDVGLLSPGVRGQCPGPCRAQSKSIYFRCCFSWAVGGLPFSKHLFDFRSNLGPGRWNTLIGQTGVTWLSGPGGRKAPHPPLTLQSCWGGSGRGCIYLSAVAGSAATCGPQLVLSSPQAQNTFCTFKGFNLK